MLDSVSRSQQPSSSKGQHRNVLIAVLRDDCDQDCSSLCAPAGRHGTARWDGSPPKQSRHRKRGSVRNSTLLKSVPAIKQYRNKRLFEKAHAARATKLPGRRMLYCVSSSRHVVPVVDVIKSSVGEWLSLVEHLVRDQGVGGSNPLSPTNPFKYISGTSGFSSTAL